jgi:hypothetical protein
MCYTNNKSKQFAWDVCGDIIVRNLLKNNNGTIQIPVASIDGAFVFKGDGFTMQEIVVGGVEYD